MWKKYALIAAAGLLINTAHAFANRQMQQSETETINCFDGGGVLGLGYTSLNSSGILQTGYYGQCWMFDIGASYASASHHFHSSKFHNTFLLGHIGPRNRLCHNLFISYGVMAGGNIFTPGKDRWTVGAFTGLDYQFKEHFLISGKVYPYNYSHGSFKGHNVFANSTISFFYLF
ncbi:MAG: hypothetical protein JSS10_05150 [Verrucomicrobia bacterium]|nr:hypothetical protein [Verrucomicrobiota bacterium]